MFVINVPLAFPSLLSNPTRQLGKGLYPPIIILEASSCICNTGDTALPRQVRALSGCVEGALQ